MLKVLIISQYWHPENGVPQRRWSWLTKHLTDEGYEVSVIAPPPHYERKLTFIEWFRQLREIEYGNPEPGSSGEVIYRSGFVPAGKSLTKRALNQLAVSVGTIALMLGKPGDLKNYRPDLVIGTVPALPTAFVTAVVAWALRTPYMIDLRDAWPDLLSSSKTWNKALGKRSALDRLLHFGPIKILNGLTEYLLNWSIEGATVVSVTSSELAENLEKSFSGKHQIATIRNVFPVETTATIATKEDSNRESLRVLYAGTIGRAQNLENAFHAALCARELGVDLEMKFVGTGAARNALIAQFKSTDLNVEFIPKTDAKSLSAYYEWADTALVHLTDWEPLWRAVPSKTYELMSLGIHITGVVSGETANLIESLQAGNVVEPENPEALAKLWHQLATNRKMLQVGDAGKQWVAHEQQVVAPRILLSLVEKAIRN